MWLSGLHAEMETVEARMVLAAHRARDLQQGLARGRNAVAIWQDLVTDDGFTGGYQTVKRFVRKLRGKQVPEAAGIARHEDALFLGPPGTGKSHLAQAIGKAVITQGFRVIYREAHILLDEIADAALDEVREAATLGRAPQAKRTRVSPGRA